MTTSLNIAPIPAPAEIVDPPCCPVFLGDVCWDDGAGSTGRAFALRLDDGSLQYVDQAGGGDISQAFIVPCELDQPWETIESVVTRLITSGAGVVAAGAASVTIVNTGAAPGIVQGAAFAPGEAMTISAYEDPTTRQFVRVPQITYNGAGTTLSVTRQA